LRGLDASLLHRTLDPVGERRIADLPLDRRPAGVTRKRGGKDVVMALERRQSELPGAPGIEEAMQAYERRPGASAVRWGEAREQAPKLLPA
jgi:hypothetical protein